ncbi:hypothetical protein H6G80_03130 [Nostoc sp. FACHB-87]|uniref:hypothetical protein n=1 Tax=Nostocaceae TaxID=1162 RepID=UPI001683231C|nr:MULTISPECIES: hypothetical protein [Nostocaceae]MBD2416069.1 hypothetical protein [Nostoc calcicola FACHB-3891]MBD2453067.1 hypothetical protein [Nostoc sp. FACHB-87]MBD2475155.1 hypothetical protein [Anabaena sp. FACHB-83]
MNEKPNLTNERIAMLGVFITLLTISSNVVVYLISGGFSAGTKLSEIKSDIKIMRNDIKSSNQMQDYRIKQLEEKINPQ